jgi:hypothetical protein
VLAQGYHIWCDSRRSPPRSPRWPDLVLIRHHRQASTMPNDKPAFTLAGIGPPRRPRLRSPAKHRSVLHGKRNARGRPSHGRTVTPHKGRQPQRLSDRSIVEPKVVDTTCRDFDTEQPTMFEAGGRAIDPRNLSHASLRWRKSTIQAVAAGHLYSGTVAGAGPRTVAKFENWRAASTSVRSALRTTGGAGALSSADGAW